MKKLLIIAFLLCAKSVFAQKDTVGSNVPFINNTIIYEKVVDVPNAPQNMLYSNAELWFAETRPYVATTQLTSADPALSRIVGRLNSFTQGSTKVLWETQYFTYQFNFTVQIDCKDNKYRIRIYNIQDVSNKVYTPMDEMMQSFINSKPLTLGDGTVMRKNDFKKIFQAQNTVVTSVINDLVSHMTDDNSF